MFFAKVLNIFKKTKLFFKFFALTHPLGVINKWLSEQKICLSLEKVIFINRLIGIVLVNIEVTTSLPYKL